MYRIKPFLAPHRKAGPSVSGITSPQHENLTAVCPSIFYPKEDSSMQDFIKALVSEEKNTELLNFKLLMYDVGLTKKHFFN